MHTFGHTHARAREGRPIRGAYRLQIRTTGSGAELRHRSPANRNSQRSEAQQLRPEILREILARREQLQAAAQSFGTDHRQRHRERLRRVRSDARGGSLREILAEIRERQRLRDAHKVS